MPTAVHQAPVDALTRLFIRDVIKTGLLTDEEECRAVVGSINSFLLGKTAGGNLDGKEKLDARQKQPDWSLRIKRASGQSSPTLVMEVGFSQGSVGLRKDTDRWLDMSEGRVKCVIIVDIAEDTKRRQAHRAHFQEYPAPVSLILRNVAC